MYLDLRYVLSLFALCCSLLSEAQSDSPLIHNNEVNEFAIEHWTTEQGLPNNAVIDIAKTPDGFIWLATFNGLVRFDGLEFTVFDRSNTDAFNTNNLVDLFTAQDGALWIGTNGGGLVRHWENSFEHFDTESTIGSSTVTAMSQTQDGTIWVGTKSGLGKVSDKVIGVVSEPALANLNIYTLYADAKDVLWIGTTVQGLFGYDGEKLDHYTVQNGLNSNSIRSIFQDPKGNLWVGMDQGLSIFNYNGFIVEDTVQQKVTGFVNAIDMDESGNIWLATSRGLFRFGTTIESISIEQGLSHNIVQSLLYDYEGNLWLGTYRGGLNRLKKSKFYSFDKHLDGPGQVINVTYQDSDTTWIGSDNGLVKVYGSHKQRIRLGAGNNSRVRDILRDTKGRLWICTYGGLVHFENDRVKKRYTRKNGLISNSARRIVESKDGALWIGTASGLSKFQEDKWKSYGQEAGLNDPFIMSLYSGISNELWVGTDGGGMYQLVGESLASVNGESGLVGDIIFNIDQDKDGTLWISSNIGLARYQNGTFSLINIRNGLISNSVFQTLEDDNNYIWIYTDKGVMRIGKDELISVTDSSGQRLENYIIFDESDGMRSHQVTPASISSQSEDGMIWIATVKGVDIIDGHNIPINEVPAVPKILSITGDGNLNYPLTDFSLPASNLRLEVHYTGLSYYAPERVRFKYKLENFDEDWIDVGERRVAFYTNLPPGDYNFLVAASNDDGLWTENYATVAFVKEAYFYQESWFYLLGGLAIFFLGGLAYFWRVKELRNRNLYLADEVTQRTLDVQKQNEAISKQTEKLTQLNAVKDKLFSVISHDLRGPIAAVGGVLGLMNSGYLSHEELTTHAAKLNTEVNGLTNLMDNLLSWAKSQMQGIKPDPESIQLVDLINENLSLYLSIGEVKGIAITQQIDPEHYVYSDRTMLNLVVRNLIMNAIKFTPQGGQIKVYSETLNDQIVISIEDNGVGMSSEEVNRLFKAESAYSKIGTSNETGTGLGLLLCKEFIESNEGRIWVETNEGKGSSFKFVLKKGSIQDQVGTG